MAVLHEIPGIKVTVEVDGRCAQEYADEDGPADDRSRRKADHSDYRYIESRDDAHFSVVYEADSTHGKLAGYQALGFYLMLDGAQMDSTLWEAVRYPRGGVWRHAVTGAYSPSDHSGMDSFSKFKFSRVTTVDDVERERVESDTKASKNLGLIQLLVYNVEVRPDRYSDGSSRPQAQRDKAFEVAEKALKGRAVSHGTSYSDGGLVPQKHWVSVEFKGSNPIAAYNFKYRSRDALQKELIIPRSPSPQGISGLSDAEIRRLAMERLEDVNGRRSPTMKRESKGPLIKREYQEFCDLTGDPAKREWKKIKIDSNHQAIDLTDD